MYFLRHLKNLSIGCSSDFDISSKILPMPQYGHQISRGPLSPSGGSVADSGCGKSIRDVLGAIGIWRGSNEETRVGQQDGGENASEPRKSAGASVCGDMRGTTIGDEMNETASSLQ